VTVVRQKNVGEEDKKGLGNTRSLIGGKSDSEKEENREEGSHFMGWVTEGK